MSQDSSPLSFSTSCMPVAHCLPSLRIPSLCTKIQGPGVSTAQKGKDKEGMLYPWPTSSRVGSLAPDCSYSLWCHPVLLSLPLVPFHSLPVLSNAPAPLILSLYLAVPIASKSCLARYLRLSSSISSPLFMYSVLPPTVVQVCSAKTYRSASCKLLSEFLSSLCPAKTNHPPCSAWSCPASAKTVLSLAVLLSILLCIPCQSSGLHQPWPNHWLHTLS